MQKRILLIAGFICLTMAGVASAADMIGFVNTREVLSASKEGKKVNAELEKLGEKLELQVTGSAAELRNFNEELQKQQKILTPEGLEKKQTELQEKEQKHLMLQKGAQEQMRAKQNELIGPMIQEIQKIINTIGEKDKYTAIFDTSVGNVVYKAKSLDLTKRVLDEFEKSYKPKK